MTHYRKRVKAAAGVTVLKVCLVVANGGCVFLHYSKQPRRVTHVKVMGQLVDEKLNLLRIKFVAGEMSLAKGYKAKGVERLAAVR